MNRREYKWGNFIVFLGIAVALLAVTVVQVLTSSTMTDGEVRAFLTRLLPPFISVLSLIVLLLLRKIASRGRWRVVYFLAVAFMVGISLVSITRLFL